MTPTVSIIMANFNGARFVGEAIDSVVRQTLGSWELILVDDASTDDSVGVAMRAAGADAGVKIVKRPQNGGVAAARNLGIDVAQGEWLAIFDSDDLMLPHRLELLVRRANAQGAAIIADNFLVFSDGGKRPRPHLPWHEPRWIDLSEFIHSTCIYSWASDLGFLKPMIRGDRIRALGARYDERLRRGEDFSFLAKLLVKGERLRIESSPMHLYRQHANSLSKWTTLDDLNASLAADAQLARENTLSDAEERAFRRRRHSLEAILTYERVVEALKGQQTTHALRLAVSNPRTWYYLAREIARRVPRIVQQTAQARGGTAPSGLVPAAVRRSERDDLPARMDDPAGAAAELRSPTVFSIMKDKISP